ncbi:MAG: hypothetical protein ACE5MK_12025, partial [Acidobacteriota bacterium]
KPFAKFTTVGVRWGVELFAYCLKGNLYQESREVIGQRAVRFNVTRDSVVVLDGELWNSGLGKQWSQVEDGVGCKVSRAG